MRADCSLEARADWSLRWYWLNCLLSLCFHKMNTECHLDSFVLVAVSLLGKVATLGTQETRRRQTKTRNITQYLLDTIIHKQPQTINNVNKIWALHTWFIVIKRQKSSKPAVIILRTKVYTINHVDKKVIKWRKISISTLRRRHNDLTVSCVLDLCSNIIPVWYCTTPRWRIWIILITMRPSQENLYSCSRNDLFLDVPLMLITIVTRPFYSTGRY